MQGEIICILICLPVVILCQASISNRVVTSRQLSPTALTGQGQISGPNRSARRRQMETLQTAKMVHGATPQNMTPAYEGLAAVLSVTVRENRAVAKDRGRPLTSIFLPYKSYLKRISTVTFAEVDVLFPTRYKFSLNLGPLVATNT